MRGIYCRNYSHHLVKLSMTYEINHTPYATICQGPELTENRLMETFSVVFSGETDILQGTTLIHCYIFLIIGLCLPFKLPLPRPSFIKAFAPKSHSLPELSGYLMVRSHLLLFTWPLGSSGLTYLRDGPRNISHDASEPATL